MSGRRKLPILDAPTGAVGELPPVDDGLRLPFAAPSLALLGARSADVEAALGTLRALPASRHRELDVRVTEGEGRRHETAEGLRVEGELFALPGALADADGALASASLVIATGAAVVALRRPTVTILVTGGATPSELPADVRSVRAHIDLVVPTLDAALARELVARLTT